MRRNTARRFLAWLLVMSLVGCTASTSPSPVSSTGTPTPTSGPPGTKSPTPPQPTAGPGASQTPSPLQVPLVPVVGFWSSQTSITTAELAAALAGHDPAHSTVAVEAPELEPLAAHLRVIPGPRVLVTDAAGVAQRLASGAATLGILRAAEVTPAVRALTVDGAALFGEHHLASLAAWLLLVPDPSRVGSAAGPSGKPGLPSPSFDPSALWTLAAAGDVMLDRQPYVEAVRLGKGVDWPWSGGTAVIAGSACCAVGGGGLPVGRQTGGAGAVAALFRDADLAMVNLEGPAPDAFGYHPDGFIFTMDPALLPGLRDAGIDYASLANNHIANDGAVGVADTIRHLDALGIGHAGAGADLALARRPAWFTVHGLRIAVLAYNGTGLGGAAGASLAGAAPLVIPEAVADIRAARAAGADLVVVWPHWGIEYTASTTTFQRTAAAAMIAAGADLILGNHSHWAGPVAWIDGRLVVYSLGDFIFDLERTWQTMEAVVVELTFSGPRLVQVDLQPTLILDGSQPNLLDPAGDGRAVLDQMRRASAALP